MFNWFTRKQPPQEVPAPESVAVGRVETPLPVAPPVSNRRSERLEHRELLYKVVRDAMLIAGVLAASYKFKVLSLDASGLQYLIMMDLVPDETGDMAHLAEMESVIVQAAKLRHNIHVQAVYWRGGERAAANQQSASLATPRSPVEFPRELVAPSRLVPARVKSPAPPEFEDTQLAMPPERRSPLSGTQFGDLN